MGLPGTIGSKVRISSDEMEAYLLLPAPESGMAYTNADVMAIVNSSNVKHGLMMDAIDQIVKGRIYGREVCIARGTRPVNGTDGYFEFNFDRDLNGKPTIREDGSVDYWSIHVMEIVEAGQVIATYHEPVEGVDGTSVTGRRILAKKGRPKPPLTGKGFSRSEDNCIYTADITGKIDMVNNRIQILAIYELKGDVDLHTGNIDFRGDVIIHGNVTGGAVVKATGTVTVDGICEGCTIEAGKDILLRGGVLGGHKAVIRSKGNIHAKFFEYSTIEAEGDIEVNSALSSKMTSYGRIFIDGKHASIVGGETYATCGVEADTLGNLNEVKTYIHVGASTDVLREIVDLQNELMDAQQMLDRIQAGLRQFDEMSKAQGIDFSRDERRIALLRTKMSKQAEISSFNKELEHLNAIVERSKGAKVRVLRDVYPGTVIIIDQARLNVKDEQRGIDFEKRDGNVVMMALDTAI